MGLNAHSQLDSNYLRNYKSSLLIKVGTGYTSMMLDQTNQKKQTFHLRSNQDLLLNFGFAYRWLVFSGSVNIANLTPKTRRGVSKSTILDLSAFVKKQYFHVGYQNYKGFFISNITDINPRWDVSKGYPTSPDMSVKALNFTYSYFFKGDRFSLLPVWVGNIAVKRNAGTFVLGGTINTFHLQNDSTIKGYASNFSDIQKIDDLTTYTPMILAGYGYQWAIFKNFSFVGLAQLGGGLDFLNYVTFGEKHYNEIQATYMADVMTGFSYNQQRWHLSFFSRTQLIHHPLENSGFLFLSNRLQLTIGYRISFKQRPKWIGNKVDL